MMCDTWHLVGFEQRPSIGQSSGCLAYMYEGARVREYERGTLGLAAVTGCLGNFGLPQVGR